MIEMRRRCMGEKEPYIPAEYQQVEYLQGDGNSYILAGITYQINIEIEVKFQYYQYENFKSIIGRSDGANNQFKIGGAWQQTKILWARSFNREVSPIIDLRAFNILLTDVFRVILGSNYSFIYRNGIKEAENEIINYDNSPSFFYGGEDIGIFCDLNSYNVASNFSTSKIFKLNVRYGDTLSRELIPCYRKVDLVAGMYDRVNGVFYTNAGTGEFIVGPDVN